MLDNLTRANHLEPEVRKAYAAVFNARNHAERVEAEKHWRALHDHWWALICPETTSSSDAR